MGAVVSLGLARRRGRVVEGGSLENCCAARYRGFESYRLRQKLNGSLRGAFSSPPCLICETILPSRERGRPTAPSLLRCNRRVPLPEGPYGFRQKGSRKGRRSKIGSDPAQNTAVSGPTPPRPSSTSGATAIRGSRNTNCWQNVSTVAFPAPHFSANLVTYQ